MKKIDKQKIEEIQNERFQGLYKASEKVSAINGTLNISGIANSWLLIHYEPASGYRSCILIALFLFVFSIFSEYIHYVIEVIVKWLYSKKFIIKKTVKGEEIRPIPTSMLFIAWFLWGAKIILTIIAYVILGIVVIKSV